MNFRPNTYSPNLSAAVAKAQNEGYRLLDTSELALAHPDLVDELRSYHPVKLAAAFAGYLTHADLHASGHRLEALVQLSVRFCNGTRKPNTMLIARAFKELGTGICGRIEDPSENAFVTTVNNVTGNFRVFNGMLSGVEH